VGGDGQSAAAATSVCARRAARPPAVANGDAHPFALALAHHRDPLAAVLDRVRQEVAERL
jgi:hypothetical protein